MFLIRQPYQGDKGVVKFSTASTPSFFYNHTPGIALKYVFKGQEEYLVNQEHIRLSAGQFMILPHNQSYSAYIQKRYVYTQGVCIDLNPDLVMDRITSSDWELFYSVPFQCLHFSTLGQSIHGVGKYASLVDENSDWNTVFTQLGYELMSFYHDIQKIRPILSSKAKKINTQKDLISKLFKAKDFIHQLYSQPLHLSKLSREVGMSQYHFHRLFHAIFQQTPQQLQLELRMKATLEWMKDEHLSLADIAYKLGYNDLAAFSNQVKSYYQRSPSELRNTL